MKAGLKKEAFDMALMKSNLSQLEFCKLANVRSQYISELKNKDLRIKHQSCGAAMRRRILKAFNAPPSFSPGVWFELKK